MSKEQDTQIVMLNGSVKATLGPSKIHGIGVFAIRDIKKNERVYCDQLPKLFKLPYSQLNKLFPEIREIIIGRWPSIINGSKFISPDARLISFMNHSDTPNYFQVSDTARCDIKKGEEITENYQLMPNWQKIYPWLVKEDKV